MHDVCIVGAGPAGLNAALVLGRCGRDVIMFDSGQPRNAASRGLHCFLSRDGIPPRELRDAPDGTPARDTALEERPGARIPTK